MTPREPTPPHVLLTADRRVALGAAGAAGVACPVVGVVGVARAVAWGGTVGRLGLQLSLCWPSPMPATSLAATTFLSPPSAARRRASCV